MPESQGRSEPEYRTVASERDISDLIPGDRVPVVLEAGEPCVVMVYGGHFPHPVCAETRCTFITDLFLEF